VEMLFTSRLGGLLAAVAEEMDAYVPVTKGDCPVFGRFDASKTDQVDFNSIRMCEPAKEFLFPMRELAAVFPDGAVEQTEKPFAVFGLKSCDLKAIDILDRVFNETDFQDPFYIARKDRMFIISSDCMHIGSSCCCSLFGGKVYPESGFDLNVSKIEDGFLVEIGSEKGRQFVERHANIFSDAPWAAVDQRDGNRTVAQKQLEDNNLEYMMDRPIHEIVENSIESQLFDEEAANCVECQACTRVCPTCHCFFLYDAKDDGRFEKVKMWDSCVRLGFAQVAGGANPRKMLGDRARHRLLHKFVYFLERYGIEMCVGCGRCIDACAGEVEIRQVLKRLNEELKSGSRLAK